MYVATPDGGELALDPGREVVARVVAAGADGTAKINLAGQTVDVHTDAPLAVGDEVRLAVTRADATGVRLAIIPPEAPVAIAATGTSATVGSPLAQQLVQELAKAGVPVTPQIASAATQLAAQLGGTGGDGARAVASLAGRDLLLSPAAAGRVATAIELAGAIGPALESLASRSTAVAAALPTGVPNADALRALLAPGLSSSELAVARIVQATQASAPNGPMTLPSPPSTTSAAVIQNYVSSQVAVTTQLDELAAQNTPLGTAALLQARGTPPTQPAQVQAQAQGQAQPPGGLSGLAPAALQAALRGQATAQAPQSPQVPATLGIPTAVPAPAPASVAAAATATAHANATAAAATGAASAIPLRTSVAAAGAIADLAELATRFAPAVAPGTGAIGDAAASAARGINASEVAQQTAGATTIGGAAASVAGAGADGDPMPVVTALRAFLASPGAEADAARLLRTLGGATPQAVTAAIQTFSESDSLVLAGRLLDLLPDGAKLSGPALADLRAGVHAALDRLGDALSYHARAGQSSSELHALRTALEQVASNDPRPTVAADAQRLLAAVDGQQILSRTATGADPGFVYFQVPLPNGRGAEVLVRRDPGRRQVTFDEFRIAFLLDTQRLGTLMIELDAHPASIRADVRTDVPALEPWLRDRTEQLIEPLAREARRQVVVTTGVFDNEPPASLLEPRLGALEPGVNEFYA